ncbi:unnamed protein product [Coregonus sp. 'balchen']|nr:unnamed protein product [Coregonus sp. 'balchen']
MPVLNPHHLKGHRKLRLAHLELCLAASFLKRMREYILHSHHQLIETLTGCPPLGDFVLSCSSPSLCIAYNCCLSALMDLRSYHFSAVAR